MSARRLRRRQLSDEEKRTYSAPAFLLGALPEDFRCEPGGSYRWIELSFGGLTASDVTVRSEQNVRTFRATLDILLPCARTHTRWRLPGDRFIRGCFREPTMEGTSLGDDAVADGSMVDLLLPSDAPIEEWRPIPYERGGVLVAGGVSLGVALLSSWEHGHGEGFVTPEELSELYFEKDDVEDEVIRRLSSLLGC